MNQIALDPEVLLIALSSERSEGPVQLPADCIGPSARIKRGPQDDRLVAGDIIS